MNATRNLWSADDGPTATVIVGAGPVMQFNSIDVVAQSENAVNPESTRNRVCVCAFIEDHKHEYTNPRALARAATLAHRKQAKRENRGIFSEPDVTQPFRSIRGA